MRESPRRPFGATLVSLLLGWLSVAGVVSAFALKAAAPVFDGTLPRLLPVFIYTAQSWRFTFLALACVLTSLTASIGIWYLRPWMTRAVLAWCSVAMTFLVWLALVARQEMPATAQINSVPGLIVAALVLTGLYLYARKIATETRDAAL